MGHKEHLKSSEQIKDIRISLITVSDSRDETDDKSGNYLCEKALEEGYTIIEKVIVKDDPWDIKEKVREFSKISQVLIITGGTGISRRDNTVDAVKVLVDKEIPGFGEIFRYLSFKEIGASSFVSGAFAGTIKSTVVFVIPGSTGACRLAMEELILPQIKHLIYELNK